MHFVTNIINRLMKDGKIVYDIRKEVTVQPLATL